MMLSPERREEIEVAVMQTIKALGFSADQLWITQNQAKNFYGISPQKLQKLILEGAVRVKDKRRVNPHSQLLVSKTDVANNSKARL